jgi:excisionase family DNA binding protein
MTPTPATDSSPPTRLLTIAEVADALGVEVRHVRRLVQERRIPYIKWGHLLRFDPTDIATWIDTYRRYPNGPGARR